MLPSMPSLSFCLDDISFKKDRIKSDVNEVTLDSGCKEIKVDNSIFEPPDVSDLPAGTPDFNDKLSDDELVLLAANSSFVEKKKASQVQPPKKRRKVAKTSPCGPEDISSYFAETYFVRVQNTLDGVTFEKFVSTLCEYEGNGDRIALYKKIQGILSSYPELLDQFVGFLSPQEAKFLNKVSESELVYGGWSLFKQMDSGVFNRFLNCMEQLSNRGASSFEVHSTVKHLFKSQPDLYQAFSALLPSGKPTPCPDEAFTRVVEVSGDADVEFDRVRIPYEPDRGCEAIGCKCVCHEKGFLCSVCNIKFIKGQVFVQTSKGPRVALMQFEGVDTRERQAELHPLYTTQRDALEKLSSSPTKTKAKRVRSRKSRPDNTSDTPKRKRTRTKSDSVSPKHKRKLRPEKKGIPIVVVVPGTDSFDFIPLDDIAPISPENHYDQGEIRQVSEDQQPCDVKPDGHFESINSSQNQQFHLVDLNEPMETNSEQETSVILVEPINNCESAQVLTVCESVTAEGSSDTKTVCEMKTRACASTNQSSTDDGPVHVESSGHSTECPAKLIEYSQQEGCSVHVIEPEPLVKQEDTADNPSASFPQEVVPKEEGLSEGEPSVSVTSTDCVPPQAALLSDPQSPTAPLPDPSQPQPSAPEESAQKVENVKSARTEPVRVGTLRVEGGPSEWQDVPRPVLWTRDEDKVILEAFQKEIGTEQTFNSITALMPHRSLQQIHERFSELLRLLEKITLLSERS